MKVTRHTKVTFTVTLELDEADARALHVLSQFGPDETYKTIVERLTGSFSREGATQEEWRGLMVKVRDQIGPALRAVKDARELLQQVKP